MTARPNPFAGRSIGFLLLCGFLIVYGVLRVTNIHFVGDQVAGGVATAVGVLMPGFARKRSPWQAERYRNRILYRSLFVLCLVLWVLVAR